MHLGGALIRQHTLQIVGVPHDRVLPGNPIRTQQGPTRAGDPQRLTHIVELADTDLLGLKLAGISEPAEVHGQQIPLLQLHRHVGELGLSQLEPGQRPAELNPARGVVQNRGQAVPRRAERTPDDAVPRLSQTRQRGLQATSLRQPRRRGESHLVEDQLAGCRSTQRKLVVNLIDGHPRTRRD